MRTMDLLTILGFLFAIIAIAVGSVLKGVGLQALVSGAAFMIVVVGTLAAIMVHTPLAAFRHAMGMIKWIVRPPAMDGGQVVVKMLSWSSTARKQGLLGLEGAIDSESDGFLRSGLQLVVDGTEPELIRAILEIDLSARERSDYAGAKVFESMGVYAPTLGIIGAVLGLMAVMQNLAEPAKLGSGIAAAFTATVYGIGLANLLFLPCAAKLKSLVANQSHLREMMIDGLVAIAQGDNPRSIDARLRGYLG